MAQRYVAVRLSRDDRPPNATALERTFLNRIAPSFRLDTYFAKLDAEDALDPSRKRLWSDVAPVAGRYAFEIATELPYYPPRLEGQSEYVVTVRDREYFVCLRVARVFVGPGLPKGPADEYLLAHQGVVPSLVHQAVGDAGFHVVPLRTFLSHRFEVSATNAADVIESEFESWRAMLARDVAEIVEAMRVAGPKTTRHLLPHASSTASPTIWLFLEGANSSLFAVQVVGDLGRAALRSLAELSAEQAGDVAELLTGKRKVLAADSALALAWAFAHYGLFAQALVQVCVACESELWRRYRAFLAERGCPNGKLETAGSDITFSQLLNVHIFAMTDTSTFENSAEILGRVNWARKCRNESVHDGEIRQRVDESDVERAIEAAQRLVLFLRATAPAATVATPTKR